MSFYIVIEKPIKDGFFPTNTKNPSSEELLKDLSSYPKVYLFKSLEDATKAAQLFFKAPREPKTGGGYGLVAEVKVEFTDIPVTQEVDASLIYNNWVASEYSKLPKKEVMDVSYQCITVSPKQITSIVKTFIPDSAKTFNSNLQDTDFTHQPSGCLIM